jgi:hypothetical protein
MGTRSGPLQKLRQGEKQVTLGIRGARSLLALRLGNALLVAHLGTIGSPSVIDDMDGHSARSNPITQVSGHIHPPVEQDENVVADEDHAVRYTSPSWYAASHSAH